MISENMLVARSENELEYALKSLDVSVPKRSNGRKKEHTERYAIAYMLSTLLGKGVLSFPLELLQRERPDFLLSTNSGKIGIEHTEAVSQNEAHKSVLRDQIGGAKVHFIPRHLPDEPKKSAKKLIEELKKDRAGPPWMGDSVEREWSDAMLHFINLKVVAFAKDGFEKFDQNWLLIYDNWSLPALERKKAFSMLFQKALTSKCFESFDDIFIHSGAQVCRLSPENYISYEINDLWT